MEGLKLISGSQAHKAVRNLVVNEYGITKEYTEKLIKEKIELVTNQYLTYLNTDLLERTIKRVVLDYITEGVKGGEWYDKNTSFDSHILQIIKKTVQQEIIKRYDFTIERK